MGVEVTDAGVEGDCAHREGLCGGAGNLGTGIPQGGIWKRRLPKRLGWPQSAEVMSVFCLMICEFLSGR